MARQQKTSAGHGRSAEVLSYCLWGARRFNFSLFLAKRKEKPMHPDNGNTFPDDPSIIPSLQGKMVPQQKYEMVDPNSDTTSGGNMTSLMSMVGPSMREFLLIYNDLSSGVVMTDECSNVLWVSPKIERMTGYSLEDMQSKGLQLLLPNKYHAIHHQWVMEMDKPFRTMAERGPININCQNDSTVSCIIHVGSFALRSIDDGTIKHYRYAILQKAQKEVEYTGINKNLYVLGEVVNKLGTRTLLFLLAAIMLYLFATLGPRAIRIWELRQLDQKSQDQGRRQVEEKIQDGLN